MAVPGIKRINWEVTTFEVLTTSPEPTSAIFFANGRMQVPVDVLIRAIDPDNHQRYRLTQAELDTIQLVEYHNPNNLLTGAWSYSDESNEFAHALLSSEATGTNPALNEFHSIQDDRSPDNKRYYVTTTRVEHRRVAARIRQPNGTTQSTHNGSRFDSYVHLTAIPPVDYNRSTISVDPEVIVPNGFYWMQARPPPSGNLFHEPWTQVNYYVSTSVHPFLKAEIHGFNPRPSTPSLTNSYLYMFHGGPPVDLKLHYIWENGPQARRSVGEHRTWTRNGVTYTVAAQVSIIVNQRRNALCLTRMSFENGHFGWNTGFRHPCGFELYDIYGNHGSFTASHSADGDEIVILSGRPRASAIEQDHEHSAVVSQDGAQDKPKL